MESTLSLQYKDLAGEVGLFLGYGRGAALGETAWTTQQQSAIDSCVRSGLRSFYFPPALEGMEAGHDWSFLKPSVLLSLPAGTTDFALPDDFGGFEGEVLLSATTSGNASWGTPLVSEAQVREKLAALPDTTGRPTMAALAPRKGTGAFAGQRFGLLFWPKPDQAYAMRFCYYVNAGYLDSGFPYHMGGMAHAETVLESCLAVAEQRLDDTASVHTMKFRERLRASINADRRMKPQTLGYNADRSDSRSGAYGRGRWDNPVTYRGVTY